MLAAVETDVCSRSRRKACVRMNFFSAFGRALLLSALLHLGTICSVEGLLCYCTEPYDVCQRRNFTCEIDDSIGVCGTYFRQHSWARQEYSCLKHVHQGFGIDRSSCLHLPDLVHVHCCNSSDLCNIRVNLSRPTGAGGPLPTTLPVVTVRITPSGKDSSRDLEIALPFSLLFVVLLVALIVVVVYFRRKKKLGAVSRKPLANGSAHVGDSIASSYDSYNVSRMFAHPIGGVVRPPPEAVDLSSSRFTSGSGAGAVYLVQRTLSREIELKTCIGRGRFGEVHSGVWQGEDVAVKIFYSRDEQSWLCETQIYNSVLLRHEHILTFYGSDVRSNNDCTELWLITQYHSHGSLYDYLVDNEIDVETGLKFAYSIASGLNHLHTEIQGTCGKRSIAHRDLKSKNILVKDDLNCCIADLGLAVMHDPDSDEPPDVPNHKVGTKRYMSPEMLAESINVHRFNAFRCADIYALGLVLWEIGRRCRVDGQVLSYELPYYDHLMPDPSVEEVQQVVVVEKHRPIVPEHLLKDTYSRHLAYTMRDCWRERPGSRITALRIKKTFYDLKKKRYLPAVTEANEGDVIVQHGPSFLNGHIVQLPPLSPANDSSRGSQAVPNGNLALSSTSVSALHSSNVSDIGCSSSSSSHHSNQHRMDKVNGDSSCLEHSSLGNGRLQHGSVVTNSMSAERCSSRGESRQADRMIHIGGWSEGTSVNNSVGDSQQTCAQIESSC